MVQWRHLVFVARNNDSVELLQGCAVAVDAGALSELCLEGKNGHLVRVDNVEAVAYALIDLVDHPKKRALYGKKSIEIAQKHDVKVVIPRFEKLYKEVISEVAA